MSKQLNIRQRRELESILGMASVDEDMLADAISDLIVDRDAAQLAKAQLETARLAELANIEIANEEGDCPSCGATPNSGPTGCTHKFHDEHGSRA